MSTNSMLSLHPRIFLLRSNWRPRVRSLFTTVPAYAGHNKVLSCPRRVTTVFIYLPVRWLAFCYQWSKIQQKKGVNDQRRSQVYARVSRVSNERCLHADAI